MAALLAGSALEAFGRLPFFQNNAYPDLVRILQSVIYSLVSVLVFLEHIDGSYLAVKQPVPLWVLCLSN